MAENAILLMKLTGGRTPWIKGESEVKMKGRDDSEAVPGWIELIDWSWGVATEDKKKEKKQRVVPGTFNFSKLMDRATTQMLAAAKTVDALTAEVILEDTLGGYFQTVIHLTEVHIVDYSFETKIGEKDAEIVEKWKFSYEVATIGVKSEFEKALKQVSFFRPPDAEVESTKDDKLKNWLDGFDRKDLDAVWKELKQKWGDKYPDPATKAASSGEKSKGSGKKPGEK